MKKKILTESLTLFVVILGFVFAQLPAYADETPESLEIKAEKAKKKAATFQMIKKKVQAKKGPRALNESAAELEKKADKAIAQRKPNRAAGLRKQAKGLRNLADQMSNLGIGNNLNNNRVRRGHTTRLNDLRNQAKQQAKDFKKAAAVLKKELKKKAKE